MGIERGDEVALNLPKNTTCSLAQSADAESRPMGTQQPGSRTDGRRCPRSTSQFSRIMVAASAGLCILASLVLGNTPMTGSMSKGGEVQLVPHDDKAIERLTYRYFALRDAGDTANAYALFDDSFKSTTTVDTWGLSIRAFNSRAGRVQNRLIKKIIWYDNPPSAPAPGTYAAADFVSQFENLSVHCGYVMWLGGADDSFHLIREQENIIDKASEARLTQNQLKALRSRFGC